MNISELETNIKHLIPLYSKIFQISEEGSREFLRLAIIESIKTYKELKLEDNGIINGKQSKIESLKNEIANWDENEFDLEDFEVIGYCKNIR